MQISSTTASIVAAMFSVDGNSKILRHVPQQIHGARQCAGGRLTTVVKVRTVQIGRQCGRTLRAVIGSIIDETTVIRSRNLGERPCPPSYFSTVLRSCKNLSTSIKRTCHSANFISYVPAAVTGFALVRNNVPVPFVAGPCAKMGNVYVQYFLALECRCLYI